MSDNKLMTSARASTLFALLATSLFAQTDAPPATPQQLLFTPFHSDGIYRRGEKAGWTASLPAGISGAKYTYTIKKNNLDVLKSGTLDLSSGNATIEITLGEPAMVYVEISAYPSVPKSVEGPMPPARPRPVALGAAVAPSELQLSAPRPADFDSFWDAKLKALAQIPINPVLTPLKTDIPGVELSLVKLDSLGSNVQGYFAKPAREGKFPALVVFQYAGVYALQTNTVTSKALEGWLTLDVDSHDMPPTEATGVSRNYQAIGNTDRETSYFLNMYLRDARAIDYIASRPDWDGKTIVLLGTSMGGQQSLVTAGLRPDKITALVVNEPSGADSNGDLHGRKAGYPNWPSNDPKVMQTALYFDTVNFASRIKAQSVVAIGFIDTTAPPAGIWEAVNQIAGPKEVIPMIESAHNNLTPEKQVAWNSRSKEVLNLIQTGRDFKPNEQLTRPVAAK
jgi:cephalosporin-C deacetylase